MPGRTFLVVLLFFSQASFSFTQEKRIYPIHRISEAITLDGNPSDPEWSVAEWQGDFVQHEPLNGRKPAQETRFKMAYDDQHLYVLIQCQDTRPDSIERRLSRRDDMEGDLTGIELDSYNDQLTAFAFTVSASGVKSDFMVTGDGNTEDPSWDPVWYVKTAIRDDGWIAEMKIPLSQLRFDPASENGWGLEVFRFLFRKEEVSLWQHVPKDAPGWVHQFGRLSGFEHLNTRRQVEIAPYLVSKLTRNPANSENPFEKRTDWNPVSAGVDAKIGLSNNFILDLTLNPDFGQVEADPSEVNLTAFETYFPEKRPFFIEGKSLFTYPLMGGDGDMADNGLFYSRRIGRRPQYEPELEDGDETDLPEFTRILGAAKVTGKTKSGFSVGLLESLTAREEGLFRHADSTRKIAVEPLTNYSAAVIQKEFDKGNTVVGGIFTATNRNIRDENLKFLPGEAYTGGVNFSRYWKNRNYYVSARLMGSSVSGSRESMVRLQEAPARYFQRPDIRYVHMDSTLSELNGSAGRFEIGKSGGGHWRYACFLSWRSPGLELNDMGYLRTTNEITEILWVGYRIWEPFAIFRHLNLNLNHWREYNFDWVKAMDGGNFNFNTQLKNYWNVHGSFNLNSPIRYSTLLRGGPMFMMPWGYGTFTGITTDQRKKLYFELEAMNGRGADNFQNEQSYSLGVTFKPSSFLQLTLMPGFEYNRNSLQYITTLDYTAEKRYIFGALDQKTLNISVRVNWCFSPTMSLQYWGQPFVARGTYNAFRKVTNPLAESFSERTHLFTENEISYDEVSGEYLVYEDGHTVPDYSFSKPDFKWSEFKSNLVYRWEFTPGSSLYLVWSQYKSASWEEYSFRPGSDLRDLFRSDIRNIFLLKFSYRFRT